MDSSATSKGGRKRSKSECYDELDSVFKETSSEFLKCGSNPLNQSVLDWKKKMSKGWVSEHSPSRKFIRSSSLFKYFFTTDLGKRSGPQPHVILGLMFGFIIGWLLFFAVIFPLRHPTCPKPLSRLLSFKPKLNPCSAESPRDFLFVGVITANMFLSTRAKALYDTWGRYIPGKVIFFSSLNNTNEIDLPIISLPGVDDSYPPQKKSFMMIKYIYENCLDSFEWFIRADDDIHYKIEELEKFLRSINSSEPWYIGQPGQGNKEEFGKIGMEYNENFCMGGPGVILSKQTILRMGPHIKDCLKNNIYTYHEDLEIGRCVRKWANINCTWNYEMQKILYHMGNSRNSYTGNLELNALERAVSMHPIKKPPYQYRLANHVASLKIRKLKNKLIQLKREILDYGRMLGETDGNMGDEIPREFGDLSTKVVYFPPYLNDWKSRDRSEVISWDFFDKRSRSDDKDENPRMGHGQYRKTAFQNLMGHLMAHVNELSDYKGRFISIKEINYGYVRHVPDKGIEYTLNLLILYAKLTYRKMNFKARWYGNVRLPFAEIEFQEFPLPEFKLCRSSVPTVPPTQSISRFFDLGFGKTLTTTLEPVNFILTLAGRFENFKRFMGYYEAACFTQTQSCTMLIVLYSTFDPLTDKIAETEAVVNETLMRYPHQSIRVIRAKGKFNRGVGLEIGATYYPDDALLFFVDVDLAFSSAVVDRVRLSTIEGRQVYYPIVYSQFSPVWTFNVSKGEVIPQLPFTPGWDQSKTFQNDAYFGAISGYWRFGFGMASIYNSDLRKVGGFDLSIQGWGKEDVDLFTKVLNSQLLDIIRTPDIDIVHIHHDIHCDRSLKEDQLRQCFGTQFTTLLSQTRLAQIMLPFKDSFKYRANVSTDIIPR